MRSGQIMLWVRMIEVGVPFLNKLKRWHSGPFQGWGANQWSLNDDEMHLC